MTGAPVFVILNRLQMLKKSRGRRSKRPDSRRETPPGPLRTPQGDVTNRRVTSVSVFQRRVNPSPFRHAAMDRRSPSRQHSSSPSHIASANLTLSVAIFSSNLLLYSVFRPPSSLSLSAWSAALHFFTGRPLSLQYKTDLFTGNINANECRRKVYSHSKNWLVFSFLELLTAFIGRFPSAPGTFRPKLWTVWEAWNHISLSVFCFCVCVSAFDVYV